MATRDNKIKTVEALKSKLDDAKGIFLADFQGMDVAQATELRNRCREAGVEFEVVKNTLVRRALDEDMRRDMEPYLFGPTALATSAEDEVAPAKIIADFIKEFELPRFKAGVVDGRVVDADQVTALAKLPSKEVLISMLLSGLKSPIQLLHGALSSPLRNLATVLKQVADKQA